MPPFAAACSSRVIAVIAVILRGRLCGAGGVTGAADDTAPVGTMSGTPQVLLAPHLKQLKPPAVPREYDKVARECAREGVDHPRYLLRLIELELTDRERRIIERRIRAARFPAAKDEYLRPALVLAPSPPSLIRTSRGSSWLLMVNIGIYHA